MSKYFILQYLSGDVVKCQVLESRLYGSSKRSVVEYCKCMCNRLNDHFMQVIWCDSVVLHLSA